MKKSDHIAKALMYAFQSSVKNKHVDAFVRYGTLRKFVNLVRVEAAMWLGQTQDFGYPYMLTIEPTNRCNLRCPLCPTGKGLEGREYQDLNLSALETLLSEVGRYVYMINFQNWGEPMLARELPAMVKCAKSFGISTTIATNGNYAPKLNEKIIEAGLDNIVVAVDGAKQDTYEQYRQNGKLKLVLSNVKRLVELKKELGAQRPFVEIQFLVFDHNRHEIEEVKAISEECGADGLLIRAAVAPGNRENRRKFYTWNGERDFCRRFWYTASINADLGVTPCCNFFFQKDDLGNIESRSFKEVWDGNAYTSLRKAVVKRDYDALHENCRACKKYFGGLGCETYGVDAGNAEPELHEIAAE